MASNINIDSFNVDAASQKVSAINVKGMDLSENLSINGFTYTTSSVELENNKAASINVSTYTTPVEITPQEGKDAMKKVTITLTNIGGVSKLYAWGLYNEEVGVITLPVMYTTSGTPEIGDDLITSSGESGEPTCISIGSYTVEGYSDGKITVTYNDESIQLSRSSSDDVDLR